MISGLLVTSAIKIAAEFFPALAPKISGKNAEGVAGQVVDLAIAAAGLSGNAKVEEVIAKLNADRQAQQELRLELEKLDAAEHERILKDRDSARDYQARVGSAGRTRSTVMLVGVSVGLVACVFLVAWPRSDGSAMEGATLGLITTIAGALLKMFSDAFAFEFGSSRGSKDKSDQIRAFTEQLEDVGRENTRLMGQALPKAPATQLVAPSYMPPPGGRPGGGGGGSGNVTLNAPNAETATTIVKGEDDGNDPIIIGSSPRPSRRPDAPDADGGGDDPTDPRPFVRLLVEGRLDFS